MKLSKAQTQVVAKMKEGWQLGRDNTATGGWWLQKDGLGRGGDTITVNGNSAHALFKSGVIQEKKWGFPTSLWELTKYGKSV